MKQYQKILIMPILLFFLPTYTIAAQILFNKLSGKEIANYLNWTPVAVTTQNLCGGYYKEPEIVHKYPVAAAIKTAKVSVTAQKQVFYAMHGDSVLEGNVTMTQPGRLLKADKVILHRNLKTGKITSADLVGHVQLREFGKLIVGNKGYVDFANNLMSIDNGIYWLTSPSAISAVNLTGKLKHLENDENNKLIVLKNATYHTCRPDSNAWHIWTSTLQVNRKNDMVTADNAIFYVKDIPLLYAPYLRFSLSRARKTGFLYPTIGESSSSGVKVGLPFYLNLAPNYDATITPNYFSKRGLFTDGKLRFLTSSSAGELNGGFIYHDQAFKKFQIDALNDPANFDDPALKRLKNDSTNRGYVSFTDTTKFNNYLSTNLDLNYVSDDYFFNDIVSDPTQKNDDQLLNQLDINFNSQHWRFLGRLQAYQTLHMLDSDTTDQYARLPQLNLTADYPDQWLGMDYKLNTEFVDFQHWPDTNSDFIANDELVTGGRLNVQPSVNLPLNWRGAYINPSIQLPITYYDLYNQPTGNPAYITRVLPMFDIDSEMSFARDIKFFGTGYTQTLEPRVMYLYVPKQDQTDIPTFDSSLQSLTIDTLFRTNRFSGIDRIGDANQVALGLTTRFLDANTGEEKLKASLGQIVALQKHQICTGDDCTLDYAADPLLQHYVSPLLGKLQYNLSPHWNISGDAAWDFYQEQVNNSTVTFQYLPDADHIINIGYNFEADGDTYNDKTVNLNRIDVSAAWVVFNHWRLMGEWNYNISNDHSLSYLYGLEYNGCCWALRVVADKVRLSDGTYDRQYGIQIMLKGIGSYGANNPGSMLTNQISGFSDNFNKGFL